MLKQQEKKYNEVRLRKGRVDDVAIDELHLEDMTGDVWWIGIYRGNKRTTFYIESKSKITVTLIENGLKSKLVEQEK